jgi:hypothetical protein
VTEAQLERRLVEAVRGSGGLAFKWVSPGTAGVMDRLVLLPIPPRHRAIVNKYLRMVELKAPGKKPSPLQVSVANKIEALGYRVLVVDSREKIDEVVN